MTGAKDYSKEVLMTGNYNGEQVQIACDASGGVLLVGYAQQDVNGDGTEAASWDTVKTTLLNNLNRIRNQITAITGEAWGTVSHSISALWAKFHATSGHAHSGAADDGKPIHHGDLTGLTDDDHTRYFDKDGSKAITGANVYRDLDSSYLAIRGGTNVTGKGALMQLFGADHATSPGRISVTVPNTAKDGAVAVIVITGATDTPQLIFYGLKRGAAASKTDGSTIAHGVGQAPVSVVCTASVAGEIISVTAIGATTFTIAIKKHDGTAGTSQTVYWMAWY